MIPLKDVTPLSYIWVPCNKCLRCRCLKQSEIVGRMVAEATAHKASGVFTLTFDEARYSALEVDAWTKPDVLLANHALKERIKYHWPEWSGRSFVVWERGEQLGRLHAHVVLFGIPRMIWQQQVATVPWWSYGRVMQDKLHPASAGYCASYVTKPEKRLLRVHSRASPRLGESYVSQFIEQVSGSRPWPGLRFTKTRQGELAGPFFEADHRVYTMSRPMHQLATDHGLLSPITREVAQIRDFVTQAQETGHSGKPTFAEQQRDLEQKERRMNTFFDCHQKPEHTENGFTYKLPK